MAKKTQYYGIKFPFTVSNNEGLFLDLNNDLHEKAASEIAHVLLTPKKTRIRMPNFGTDLINFIFSNNDNLNWGEIEEEIKEQVSKFVSNVKINKINVYRDENNDNKVYVDVNFGVINGRIIENNRMVLKI